MSSQSVSRPLGMLCCHSRAVHLFIGLTPVLRSLENRRPVVAEANVQPALLYT